MEPEPQGDVELKEPEDPPEPAESRTPLRVGDATVELDLAQLEKIEPQSMLLALLSERWADQRANEGDNDAPPQLELDATSGVSQEAVLVLLREYANTGILHWADVHAFCAREPEPSETDRQLSQYALWREANIVHNSGGCNRTRNLRQRLDSDKVQALLSAALYLGFSRLVPIVPDAPNALTWSELALVIRRRSRKSLAGVNLACQTSCGPENPRGVDMAGAGLTGVQLSHHVTTVMDHNRSPVSSIVCRNWSGAKLRKSSFALASIDGLRTEVPFMDSQMAKIEFTEADLSEASFVGAYIRHCSFVRVCLQKANFAGAEIVRCDFTDADLRECNFSGSKFELCVFSTANLEACNFGEATFSNCKFGGVILKYTSFAGCTFNPDSDASGECATGSTDEQRNYRLQAGLFHDLNPTSDLPSCDFRAGTFRGNFAAGYRACPDVQSSLRIQKDQKCTPSCGLRLTITEEHRLTQMQFTEEHRLTQMQSQHGGAAPFGGAFGGGAFGGTLSLGKPSVSNTQDSHTPTAIGPIAPVEPDEILCVQNEVTDKGEAYPSMFCVAKLDLAGANLAGANFDGCTLYNIDLSDASLRGCSFKGARLCMASLKGADASDADFTGADLSFTNLEGANFSGAQLREASFWCLVGFTDPSVAQRNGWHDVSHKAPHPLHTPNVPQGAYALLTTSRTQSILHNSANDAQVLNGARANASCEGASFRGASMHAADLRGISLRGADLRGASLCYASLEGADVLGAQLDGAIGPFDIDLKLADDTDDEL